MKYKIEGVQNCNAQNPNLEGTSKREGGREGKSLVSAFFTGINDTS